MTEVTPQRVKKVFSPFCFGAKRLKIFKIQGHVPWILPTTRAIGRKTGGIRASFYRNWLCIQGDWIPLERLSKVFRQPLAGTLRTCHFTFIEHFWNISKICVFCV